MSKNTAYIATLMKEAERLKKRILEDLLPRNKLENWSFTDEELQEAWDITDKILAISQEVDVHAAFSRAIERTELADYVMTRVHEMEQLGIPYDDQAHLMASLEDF